LHIRQSSDFAGDWRVCVVRCGFLFMFTFV